MTELEQEIKCLTDKIERRERSLPYMERGHSDEKRAIDGLKSELLQLKRQHRKQIQNA